MFRGKDSLRVTEQRTTKRIKEPILDSIHEAIRGLSGQFNVMLRRQDEMIDKIQEVEIQCAIRRQLYFDLETKIDRHIEEEGKKNKKKQISGNGEIVSGNELKSTGLSMPLNF